MKGAYFAHIGGRVIDISTDRGDRRAQLVTAQINEGPLTVDSLTTGWFFGGAEEAARQRVMDRIVGFLHSYITLPNHRATERKIMDMISKGNREQLQKCRKRKKDL